MPSPVRSRRDCAGLPLSRHRAEPRIRPRTCDGVPRLAFVHDSVADLTQVLATQGIGPIDAIVCGLPWATLPISLQETVFAAMDRALVPGGVFVTFGYLQSLVLPGAWALRRRLRRELRQGRPLAGRLGERTARLRVYLPKAKVTASGEGPCWASAAVSRYKAVTIGSIGPPCCLHGHGRNTTEMSDILERRSRPGAPWTPRRSVPHIAAGRRL